jgi:hypothetical protein
MGAGRAIGGLPGGAWAAAIALVLLPATVRAHNAALPVDVLGASADPGVCEAASGGTMPAIVVTTIGLGRAQRDGGYAFGCPSQWEPVVDGGAPLAARAADGLVGILGAQRLSLSRDAGCSFEPVASGDRASVYDIADGRDGVWFVERTDEAGATRVALGRATACGGVSRLDGPWNSDAPTVLDTVREFDCAAGRCLVVSGARPVTGAWVTSDRDGPLGEGAWTRIDTSGLGAVSRLAVRSGAGPEAWLVATRPEGARDLVRVEATGDADAVGGWLISGVEPAGETVIGPVWALDRWVAVVDGRLRTREAGAETAWSEGSEVRWSCLRPVDGTLFACADLFDVVRVEALPGGAAPVTSRVFSIDLLGPPDTGCLRDAEASRCNADWQHFGDENGLTARPTGPRCADGSAALPGAPTRRGSLDPGLADPDCGASDPHQGGCQAAPAPPWAVPGVWVLLGLWGLGPRRRRS